MTDKALNFLEQLHQEVELIDRLLFKIDKVLDSAQPNLEGKIRIYFWHAHGQKREVEPILVRRTKVKTKYPEKIQEKDLARRALSKGLFLRNYESTKSLLKITSEQLAYRRRLKEIIKGIEMSCRSTLNGNYGRTRQAELDVIRIDKDVYGRLVTDGLEDYHQEIGDTIFKV